MVPFAGGDGELLGELAAFGLPAGEKFAVAAETAGALSALQRAAPEAVCAVICSLEVLRDAVNAVDFLRNCGIEVFCEAIRWTADLVELENRISGYILKGHECSGVVSEQTTYLLLQEFRKRTDLPLIARGGIVPETAAAASVAGACGVVLDDQIMLLAESPLDDASIKRRLASMSGTETLQVEDPRGGRYLRGLDQPGGGGANEYSVRLLADPAAMESMALGFSWKSGAVAPGGQGLGLAAAMASRYRTVGRLIGAIRSAVRDLPRRAAARRALAKGGPLAAALGTQYPILQGPMTRVSDVAPFLHEVALGGALPFAAFALMKKPEAEKLLEETKPLMGERPWGVGILGFAGPEVLKPQFEALDRIPPNYVLIAGGRVHQAMEFEKKGVSAFLHVSTASLVKHYLEEGARRFIVEGRECGGHIGPLTSFTLWASIIETLRDHPIIEKKARSVQIVFAGGIHDALSAAMVATLAEPIAEKGVQIGVLMGTGYLFTREIVESGAILQDYQDVALSCGETRSLWEGPGFASRCAMTPIADEFQSLKRKLETAGATATQVRKDLEILSLGRLRMATKGLARSGPDNALAEVGLDQRRAQGMYMIGQVAALNSEVRTIAEFHDDVADGSVALLEAFVEQQKPFINVAPKAPPPADIAIVGMATLLPGSDTVSAYWRRILSGLSAISEIPEDRWNREAYFSEDRAARDKIYSFRGGFLDDVAFNPLDYGIPPASLDSVDPMQLLALELVSDALRDAACGAADDPDKSRCSVIFGFSGGLGETGAQYATRAELKRLFGEAPEEVLAKLPEWTEDSFAGILPNVAAGRVANRFNFGGLNQIVDAACASSLAAVYSAVAELESGRADMVVAGGIDSLQSAFGYLCFSKTQALSPRGICNTFDQSADGIVISEGLAAVVLKRLSDAESDGDRIYAVIKGVGASSDGRAKGLTAPLPEGQRRALDRAYAQAGFSPSKVQLLEAHGTGTVAGDKAELETVVEVLKSAGSEPRSCAIGSVKTLIGHTKAAAGVSGLIKVALGLHHRILPPHALVKKPNPAFEDETSPIYLSQTPRPWVSMDGRPRRAGVSAFGFGGTNFHVVLEEYADGDKRDAPTDLGFDLLPFGFADASKEKLEARLAKMKVEIDEGRFATLRALALGAPAPVADGSHRLSFTARSIDEAADKIAGAMAFLSGAEAMPPAGVFYNDNPSLLSGGKLAFLFSGQGSQYPDMMRQAALLDPDFIDLLGRADTVLAQTPVFSNKPRLSRYIYPGDAFTPEARKRQMEALTATEVAQPALGVIESGLLALLRGLGVAPDMAAGHSYGEFVALYASGAIGFEDLIALSEARGRAMIENGDPERPGTMAAVAADAASVREAVKSFPDVVVANVNSPKQTVIAGPKAAIDQAVAAMSDAGWSVNPVAVSQAFHSPLMRDARAQFEEALNAVAWQGMKIPVYSNTRGRRHDVDPERLRATMSEHLVSPVEFVEMAKAMAADGAAVFLEVGPRSVLANRIPEIFGAGGPKSIAMDRSSGDAASVVNALSELFAEGCAVNLRALAERAAEVAPRARAREGKPGQIWRLNGAYARKAEAPRRNVRPPSPTALKVSHSPGLAGVAATPAVPLASTQGEMEFMDITEEMLPRGSGGVPDPSDPLPQYHQLMREFLRVQESVMLSYFARNGAVASSKPAIEYAPAIVRENGATAIAHVARHANGSAANAPAKNGHAATASNGLRSFSNDASAAHAPVAAATNGAAAPAKSPAPAPAARVARHSVAAPPAERTVTSASDLMAVFIAVTADKTGYPEDALDPDQVMEQDLGIDSIKRMEILGAVQKTLPERAVAAMRDDMESISQLATIREVVEFISERISSPGSKVEKGVAEAHSRPFDLAGEAEKTVTVLPRFIQVPFFESVDHLPKNLPAGLRAIVTEAADGFHEFVLKSVASASGVGLLLPQEVLASPDPGVVKSWIAKNAAEGPLGALIYLDSRCAMPDIAELTIEDWRMRHEAGVKRFYALLQALAPHLRESGRIIAAMETGGLFGRTLEPSPSGLSAGAGVLGVVKALAHEWPACSSKVIDLDGSIPSEMRAAQLVCELAILKGRREAGYPGGKRTILRTEAAALTPPWAAPEMVGPDWIVVATGGARGITAECLRTLAPYRPTLVLLGRSAPPPPEAPEAKGLDAAGLRRYYLDAARAAGEKIRPAEIESKISRHLGDRDMRHNLADFAAMGAKVDYRSLDVLNPECVNRLFDELYRCYGRIDMVVHGAGVIEDTFIEKKSKESLDRVFDTKVDSAFLIAKALRWRSLKGICFFTSVAGRYGNRGQTDYAAANEVLNRLAWSLKRGAGAGAVVKAINWGPWDATTTGAGMVTEDVRRQFEARGIGMVKPVPGRDLFFKEMFWGAPDQVESVAWVADGESMEGAACAVSEPSNDAPLVECLLLRKGRKKINGIREITWRFDLVNAPFVDDHRFDGQAVMPIAAIMQMLSEVPAAFGERRQVIAIEDLRLYKGLTLENGPSEIRIALEEEALDGLMRVSVRTVGDDTRVNYRADLRLADHVPAGPAGLRAAGRTASWTGPDIHEIYRRWLSHGVRFQTLTSVDSIDKAGVLSRAAASRPAAFTPWGHDREWSFDPGLIDGLLQTVWIWSRAIQNASTLPLGVRAVRRYDGDQKNGPLTVETRILSAPDDPDIETTIHVYDAGGRLCYELDGFRGRSSAHLNRLGGGWQGGERGFGDILRAAE